jgi:hypothetical protein
LKVLALEVTSALSEYEDVLLLCLQ